MRKDLNKEVILAMMGQIMSDYRKPVMLDFKPVESVAAIADLLAGEEAEVIAEITAPLTLTKEESITVPAGKKLTVKLDTDMTVSSVGFNVEDGGELVLCGEGVIQTTNKTTKGAAVQATGKTALVTLDGVTIDCITANGKEGNEAYGIYLSKDASLTFKSGTIKTAYGSCIATNNLTEGNTAINILGGELLCDGSYAIYLPAQGELNIKGGKVQGINARMGHINISGDAEIIPTTITAEGSDNIGKYFNNSSCIWLGDTIAVMAGTYTDKEGTDLVLNITEDAKVKSDFRAAIGVYSVDTKEAQNVTINIENKDNVTTTDTAFEAVKVYGHDYIATEAQAAGKTYTPVAESVITIA